VDELENRCPTDTEGPMLEVLELELGLELELEADLPEGDASATWARRRSRIAVRMMLRWEGESGYDEASVRVRERKTG